MAKNEVEKYVYQWFDLKTPLNKFYALAKNDAILQDIVIKFNGLRIVKAPDLFEALCWAIIRQQINPQFAYQVKRKLVERCGHFID